MVRTSGTLITARVSTSPKSAILSFNPWWIACSLRATMTSGWMPMLRRVLTLCWVGLLLNSSLAEMKGTRVRWT